MTTGVASMVAAGFGGRRAFLPTDIAGAVLWLRADLGVTLNGSNVSAWADQASGINFVQATAANQPTFVASDAGLGGAAAIDFPGSTERITAASGAALPSVDDCSVLIVADADAASSGCLMAGGTSGTNGILRFVGGLVNVFDGTANRNFAAAITGPQHLGFYIGGSAINVRRNGALLMGSPATYDGTWSWDAASSLAVGSRVGGTEPFNGRIAEVIMYDRVLTADEIAQVEAYAATRYGL